ncbi:GntR family transcriptional regulator [Croceitalea marina]|uniref:GntR family transcriptional regulator n=1 Tax=Croceitalea marina TaxID=1775166 RepID=A0ABW5MZQ0_9FLAO
MASRKVIESINKLREDILSGKLPQGQLLPTEKQLAQSLKLSRPTVAKIYDALSQEGLIRKKAGFGTIVVYGEESKPLNFGLLFPGAGESEIFGAISDQFLQIEKEDNIKFLWEGTIANDAKIRQSTILKTCQTYVDNDVDGVFFVPLERVVKSASINRDVCEMLDQHNIPVVLLDRDIDNFPIRSKYPVIGLDNFRAGYLTAKHIIEQGCKKIYFLYRKDSPSSVYKRIAGCSKACFDEGIDFTKENLISGNPSQSDFLGKVKIVAGETGILCANDTTAAALMANISNLGYEVTKDILVAGFDDLKYAEMLRFPLTTYKQPIEDIVSTSLQTMQNQLENKNTISMNLDLKGELIIRQSTTFS